MPRWTRLRHLAAKLYPLLDCSLSGEVVSRNSGVYRWLTWSYTPEIIRKAFAVAGDVAGNARQISSFAAVAKEYTSAQSRETVFREPLPFGLKVMAGLQGSH